MAGLTPYAAQNLLNALVMKAAYPTVAEVYLGLLTAMPNDSGVGATEVSGGGYARVGVPAASWNAASGTSQVTISNSALLTFPQYTGSNVTLVGFGLFDAATAGNLLETDWLGANPWFPFTATLASPGVFDAPGITAGSSPALANGSSVVMSAKWGGSLPAGITAETLYTVAGLSADTFNVGVNTTSVGSGLVRAVNQFLLQSGTTVNFNASSLTLQLG